MRATRQVSPLKAPFSSTGAIATAKYSVYYGEGRGCLRHSVAGWRTNRFSIPLMAAIVVRNSRARAILRSACDAGIMRAMCGFAEQLEVARAIDDASISPVLLKAAQATCDFYIESATAADGVPYWDTGAPKLDRLGDWQMNAADPFNDFEPVDSSAAAIAAQGLLRLGQYLGHKGSRYFQAGLTVLDALLDEPYLSANPKHQGLIMHSVYHRPNGWDYIPRKCKVPCGESSMWGDYHAREVALYVQRLAEKKPYLTFWGRGKAEKRTR